MVENTARAAFAAVLLGLSCQPSMAAQVIYGLDQSNTAALADGVMRATVTVEDSGNNILFTIATLPGAFNETSNFGIQSFGFNLAPGASALTAANFLLPTGWSATTNRKMDGFGRFDWVVSGNGGIRIEPLLFSIRGVAGDTPLSYIDLSSNPAAQGRVVFAAHVAGFAASSSGMSVATADTTSGVTSVFIGGSTVVPIPAAAWLLGSGLLALGAFVRRSRLPATA